VKEQWTIGSLPLHRNPSALDQVMRQSGYQTDIPWYFAEIF
jgi:hypothetical protein